MDSKLSICLWDLVHCCLKGNELGKLIDGTPVLFMKSQNEVQCEVKRFYLRGLFYNFLAMSIFPAAITA